MQITAFDQALRHELNAARAMQIGGGETAAGFEIGDDGRARADAIEVVDVEIDAHFMCDRQQVQHGVRRSACGGD